MNDQTFPLGLMHLNKLRDTKKIKIDRFKFSYVGEDEDASEDETTLSTQ
jgi:hypothetical protein